MNDYIQLINLLLSTLAFVLIAQWYILPAIDRVKWEDALQPFLLLHSFRHVGLMFLASGAVKFELDSAFARPAALGDLTASLLAFLALASIRLRWKSAIFIVWLFNIEGTLDLLYALTQGVVRKTWNGMGATFWIPSVIVPALLVTHYIMFVILIRSTNDRNTKDT
ncbi:MAG: hypothetical protein J7641_08870 [Cyanobacteria bacterium SID2]|nr:hypothetical protein [Cyanobacteria bacterium SID2]MBP0005387.1 hypothetical protein [Cyanobacteria bacterium SBC]